MQLPGRLRLTTLGDVLGTLHREAACGVLELTDDTGRMHRVYVTDGMITAVETPLVRQRLGDLLAGEGFVGARALARLARRLLEAPSQRAGEILVEEGFVSPDVISAGLRRQLRQKLEALFQLRDAQLTFRIPRAHEQPRAPLAPGEFLHGRPRKRQRIEAPRPSSSGPSSSRSSSRMALPGARTRAYAALGLLPGADRATITRAFRRLASTLHPDRFPNADPGERARLLSRFAELSAAYHSLAG
ncbi:MAG TPA: J domain-containing protein [Polyangiaceae bacterium]